MDAAKFDRFIASAPDRESRIAWFGAILGKESETPVEIVGGPAIEIYLSSAEYASEDGDLAALAAKSHQSSADGSFTKWKGEATGSTGSREQLDSSTSWEPGIASVSPLAE